MFKILGSLLLLIFFNISICKASSPLVIWSKSQPMNLLEGCGRDLVTPSTFQTFSTVFNENYLKCIQRSNPSKFVLFLQDDLTVEDLRKFYSSDFDKTSEKIRESLESSSSLMIPAFENEDFSESFVKMVSKEDPVAEIEIVHLSNDLKTSIKKISSVFETASENTFFVWISSTTNNEKESSLSRGRRDSPETDVEAAFFYNDTCLFLAFSSLNMTFEKSYGLIHLEPISETFNIKCGGNSSKFSLDFKPHGGVVSSVTLYMSLQQQFYPVSAMVWWTISNISISYNVSSVMNSTDFIPRTYRALNAPINWTLGCVRPEPIISKGKSKVQLEFEHLYILPFGTHYGEDNILDCAAWFSAPIILGLLVALLLLVMLGYANMMFMAMTTMDRFEDPKGRGLTTPQDS